MGYFYYSYSKDDFIPATFTLGRFKESAFITCKFNNEKWVSPSVFERLCGYKPHTQRDSRKEMKKAILNAVETMENVPTKGFRFVSYGGNLYNIYEFNNSSNVILQDPRGFNFSVTLHEFFDLLKANGGNMTDNVLDNVECVYAWTANGHWRYLMPTSSPNYTPALQKSRAIKKAIDETVYLGKRDLTIGHVYAGSPAMPGKYIYMGEHDVFSNECQLNAFSKQSYENLQSFRENRCDVTAEKRYVFYRIGATGFRRDYLDKLYEPYVCKSSLSKLILEECQIGTGLASAMYNSDKPCTYENVLNDMKRCMRFHKIDFTVRNSFKPMSKELFSVMYEMAIYQRQRKPGEKNIRWPFEGNCRRCFYVGSDSMIYELDVTPRYGFSCSGVNYSARVTKYNPNLNATIQTSYRSGYYMSEAYRTSDAQTYENASEDLIYDLIKPQCRQVVLDTGAVMNEATGAMFTHPEFVNS